VWHYKKTHKEKKKQREPKAKTINYIEKSKFSEVI